MTGINYVRLRIALGNRCIIIVYEQDVSRVEFDRSEWHGVGSPMEGGKWSRAVWASSNS